MKRKFFTFTMVFAIFVAIMPMFAIHTEAASGKDFTDNPIIAARIDQALAMYPEGSYFTVNGKACSYHSGTSTSNCLGYVDLNKNHRKDSNEPDLRGIQCMGYARFFQYMLFGDYGLDSPKFNINYDSRFSLTAETTKSWFIKHQASLHPGTHIRVNYDGHSIVVLGINYEKGTISFVNGNIDHHCKVSGIVTYTWAQFAVNFKSINWAATYKNYRSEYGMDSDMSFAEIPNGTYYFENNGYRMYMISDSMGAGTIGASSDSVIDRFKFNVVKDGYYYKISPVSTTKNNVLNCYWGSGGTATSSGNEVSLWVNDGDASQRWYFEQCGEGYIIHPADRIDLSITRENNKLYIRATTKEDNQIWSLKTEIGCSHEYNYQKDDNKHWKECTKCGDIKDTADHIWNLVRSSNGEILSSKETHYYGCDICDKGKREYHQYNSNCDTLCSICAGVNSKREAQHSFVWESDKKQHLKLCNSCGFFGELSNHVFGNAVVVTSPTCQRTGVEESTCSICRYTNRITLDKIDHNYVSREYEGYVDYTCTMCGTTYYEMIEIPTSVTESIGTEPIETESIDTPSVITESIGTETIETGSIDTPPVVTESIGTDSSIDTSLVATEAIDKESNEEKFVTINCQGMISDNLIIVMLVAIFTVYAIIITKKKKDI